MENFDFKNGTEIVFGKDTENRVGELTAKYSGSGNSKKVLLHYGGGSIKKTGLYDKVMKSLQSEGFEIIELGGVQPNPRLSMVKEGIELCKKNDIGFILAVGGGSVIDSAKAIGMGLCYEGEVWDFYEYKTEPKEMIPLGVVLTIPAAGSETSPSSVITNSEKKLKRGVTALCSRPQFCILNPEITYTLPDYQTACGISDMLAHTMERYFTPTKDIALSDRLCESVMMTIIEQAAKLLKNPNDYNARAEIMWCGTVAHNDFIDCGRAGDWASHGMEHEISALNDVAHGAGLSIVFPAWMKYVYKENIDRFVQFAERVFKIDPASGSKEDVTIKAIAKLEAFYKSLSLPTRLSEIEFDSSFISEMADKATFGDSNKIGGFKKLGKADVEAIYKLAL